MKDAGKKVCVICVIYDIHGIHIFNPNVSVVGLLNSFIPSSQRHLLKHKYERTPITDGFFVPLTKPFQHYPKKMTFRIIPFVSLLGRLKNPVGGGGVG